MTKMKNTIKASVGLWLLAVSNVALAASNSSSNYTRWNILTAAGDEEKVKKGKDIIIRAVFWIVAIFSINIIMKFVIEALFSNS